MNADQALAALRDSAQALRQATQVVGQEPAIANAYVQAVSHVERLLRGNFVDVPLDQLRTQGSGRSTHSKASV